jgi:NPCBM/NEW2 domain
MQPRSPRPSIARTAIACLVCSLATPLFAALAGSMMRQRESSPDFIAIPIDDEPITGRLVNLTNPWRIVLQAGDRVSMTGPDLLALRRVDPPLRARATGSYVLLANGDRIRATAHFSTQDALRINSELLGTLEIPLERIQAILLGSIPDQASRDRLERNLLSGNRKQDVVVLTNGDETSGTFLGLDEDAVRVQRTSGEVSIERIGVRAVAFSAELISFPKSKTFYAEMILADGSELSVAEVELTGNNLRGRTAFGREFVVPLEQLCALEFRNGRVKYLSDLEPIEYQHTPYLSLSYPYHRDHCVTGGPLSLRGQVFRKGLGMHSRSELTYELKSPFRRFEATVGIDDETAGQGSVNFHVLLDGRDAWQSGLITGHSAPKRVQVDTTQAKRLTLVVDFGSLGDVQDHADWADARLVE